MPELPEVETVVRGLRKADICNAVITGQRVGWERTLGGMSTEAFASHVTGATILRVTRRAKYIVMSLSTGWTLLIHLRMTGSLRVVSANELPELYERVALLFADGRELRFRDTRKFGRWYLTDAPERILGKLGPEPLSAAFTPEWLAERLRRHRRMLKPLLLDQQFIAGLGNIYVDEALFAARLHPCRLACMVRTPGARRLHQSIQSVLRLGISRMGTSLGDGAVNFYSVAGRRGRNQDALQVFRRDGEACPVCGTTISRIIVGQRSTHYCKRCQPVPRKRAPINKTA